MQYLIVKQQIAHISNKLESTKTITLSLILYMIVKITRKEMCGRQLKILIKFKKYYNLQRNE